MKMKLEILQEKLIVAQTTLDNLPEGVSYKTARDKVTRLKKAIADEKLKSDPVKEVAPVVVPVKYTRCIRDIFGRLLFTNPCWEATLVQTLELASEKKTDLRFANLKNTDLSGVRLEHTWLTEADFRGANLSGATLCDTSSEKADFRGANLKGAYLGGCQLNRANFSNSNLENSDFRRAFISGADFTGAVLTGADMWDVVGIDRDKRILDDFRRRGAINVLERREQLGIATLYASYYVTGLPDGY